MEDFKALTSNGARVIVSGEKFDTSYGERIELLVGEQGEGYSSVAYLDKEQAEQLGLYLLFMVGYKTGKLVEDNG